MYGSGVERSMLSNRYQEFLPCRRPFGDEKLILLYYQMTIKDIVFRYREYVVFGKF